MENYIISEGLSEYSVEEHIDKINKIYNEFDTTDNLTNKIKLRSDLQKEIKIYKENFIKFKDFLEKDFDSSDKINNEDFDYNGEHTFKKLINNIEKIDELELMSQIIEYKKLENHVNTIKEEIMN